jgi:hypothetical protein
MNRVVVHAEVGSRSDYNSVMAGRRSTQRPHPLMIRDAEGTWTQDHLAEREGKGEKDENGSWRGVGTSLVHPVHTRFAMKQGGGAETTG